MSKFQINIPKEDLTAEFMINALRLINGFDINLYEQRTGLKLTSIQQSLLLAQSKNLLIIKENKIKP
ncbi:MAG: hypothetical protein N4Q32_05335, partial [Neisseriaceae bacterium]|nr:hypothetical protein [Neisseriaceae bacterium]